MSLCVCVCARARACLMERVSAKESACVLLALLLGAREIARERVRECVVYESESEGERGSKRTKKSKGVKEVSGDNEDRKSVV